MSKIFRAMPFVAALATALVALGASTDANAFNRHCTVGASFNSQGVTSEWKGSCPEQDRATRAANAASFRYNPRRFEKHTAVGKSFDGSAAALARQKNRNLVQQSDIRLKQDIILLARLDDGIGLYRFRYRGSDPTTYVGVMAQEVQDIVPSAVSRGRDGYLRVNYGRLGLELMTWAEWRARRGAAFASSN